MARGGGRPKGPVPRDVLVSKKLSWLLRHGAEKEGLSLGRGGYINLADVLANNNIKSLKVSLAEIKAVVAENNKQRFSLVHISEQPGTDALSQAVDGDADPSHYLIRANQGHSLILADGDAGLLTPLTLSSTNLPEVVVHGTRHQHWRAILASGGLKPMGRNHVHFATGVPSVQRRSRLDGSPAEAESQEHDTPKVLSGARNSSTILMFLDLRRAIEQGGLEFGTSTNGVVLTEGNKEANGLVSLDYFASVEEVQTGTILVQYGKVVAEPSSRSRGTGKTKIGESALE